MKTLDDLKEIASKYVKDIKNESIFLHEPLFRIEKNKLYLGYMVIDFVDSYNNNYDIKRPTEWLLQDLITGEIVQFYNSNKTDFCNKNELPFDKTFKNNGTSALYDDINSITKSFNKWKKEEIKNLTEKYNDELNPINQEKVLQLGEDIVSPKYYILANSETVFSKMYNELFEFGNTITEAYNEFQNNLVMKVIRDYTEKGIINKEIIKQYFEFIKYSYPESLELFNCFNNISDIENNEYDKNLNDMSNYKNANIIEKIDMKLKEIDNDYNPSELKETDKYNSENVSVSDLISKIDEKLKEIDKEN